MKARFKIIEVGWGKDFDDNRHPRLRIGRANYSLVLYDHPANGWEIITMEIMNRRQDRFAPRELHGESAEVELTKNLGGELLLAQSALDTLVEDLYETGRRGAAKRWVGETITLKIEPAK